MAEELKPLQEWPGFLAEMARLLNLLVKKVRPLTKIEGRGGVKVTPSDSNIVIELEDDVGGGGIPEGYVETSITLCVDGVETPGTILFKATPPEP